MNVDGHLARSIQNGEFIVTAEHAPAATATASTTEAALKALGGKLTAVNMGDNQHGVAMSSLAASLAALKTGLEPVLQMVTRDRNRIALQSDLLGAASLGIKNVLCLSGYHQTLIGCPEATNVFDIDSTQFIAMTTRMGEQGLLANGTKFDGPFSMLVGAVANPFLKPLELNLFRLQSKIEAGARFIQTHAVFDLDAFSQWLEAARQAGAHQEGRDSGRRAPRGERSGSPETAGDPSRFSRPAGSHGAAPGLRQRRRQTGLGDLRGNHQETQEHGGGARDSYSLGWQRSRGAGAPCGRRPVLTGRKHA